MNTPRLRFTLVDPKGSCPGHRTRTRNVGVATRVCPILRSVGVVSFEPVETRGKVEDGLQPLGNLDEPDGGVEVGQ